MSRLPFIRIVGIAAVTLCGIAPLPAQPGYQPGDVIVGAASLTNQPAALLGIRPQGAVYTLVPQVPFVPYAITAAPDNRSLLVGGGGLLRVAPDGTVTSVSLGLPLGLIGLDVDGSGNVILTQSFIFNSAQPGVLKLSRGVLTTLYAWPQVGRCVGAGIDLRSGDLVFSGQLQSSQTQIMRATLHGTRSVSTLNVLFPGPIFPGYYAFPRHDPETDTFLLMCSHARIDRFSVRSPGTMTTVFQGTPLCGWVMSPGRDPGDGRFVIPTFSVLQPFPPSPVLRFDAANGTFQTLALLTMFQASAAAVAGSRHLCGLNEVWPGQTFAMLVSSPAEPGAAYAVALGLDFYPGFRLPDGRKIHLDQDALFFWSLGNAGPFSGFRGVLDARGEAVATVAVPNIQALSGFRFFASAVTVARNRISVISSPLGVTIQ